MTINKLTPTTIDNVVHPGKHKIPRYIYHLTTKSAYEKMQKDRLIMPSEDYFFGDGIFAVELSNLFKRWKQPQKDWGAISLLEKLVQYVSKGKENLCILKIPTKELDRKLLVIRSQNLLFSLTSDTFCKKHNRKDISELVAGQISNGDSPEGSLLFALEKYLPKMADHLEFGVPAKFSKLYKQRKEAIEYIYPNPIPVNCTQKIGEVNITELKKSQNYDILKPLRSIFVQLLKGTPEEKNAQLLDC